DCSHPITATDPRCTHWHQRLPAHLQQELEHTQRALRAWRGNALASLEAHTDATERELGIIRLAASGPENQHIAAELHVTVHTVRDYCLRLSKRWGCRNRAQVVARAFELGYLRIEEGPEAKVVKP